MNLFLRTISVGFVVMSSAVLAGGVEQRVFQNRNADQVLTLEWLSDGVIHFEFSRGQGRKAGGPIYTSPLVQAQNFPGPVSFQEQGNGVFVTEESVVQYANGCFAVTRKATGKVFGPICAPDMSRDWKFLSVHAPSIRNVFGLGQLFEGLGDMGVDRLGKVIGTKSDFGNGMPSYGGGATGEALFPVAFALGEGRESWALMFDNTYKQTWDLTRTTWRVGMFGDQVRGFVFTASEPTRLRQRYMAVVGKAPVPPKKMFGFWMSEYGYENWAEIDDRLGSMRKNGFPIDGFFLDLQWFGNVTPGSDHTRMGSLEFDTRNFPDAASRISTYLKREDIGLVTIEESYVGRALPEHDDLESRGYLAHRCGSPTSASYLTGPVTGNMSEWWGRGGMIDWSNPAAGQYWHQTKRQKLIDMGIYAHWLDLGEPEMFDPRSCYYGSGEPGKKAHQDIHNLFSHLWVQSLWDGYNTNRVNRRPFSMLRSGNIGMHRYGAGMWSGDISGNIPSLASHRASQNHVSWSGIDYYSSDIGGFHRNQPDSRPMTYEETQESFTQWFANSTWFDIPVRSHAMNLDNRRDTAPDRIGHVESNRINLLTRYSLVPYYYSLAHRAYKTGAALFEPMALRFPEEGELRTLGHQMMLGDILIASVAYQNAYSTRVSLPPGLWYDFIDGKPFENKTVQTLDGFPSYRQGLFRVPTFVKGGAIIPRYNGILNSRALGPVSSVKLARSMLIEVFADRSETVSYFDLYDDEGYSRDYEKGAVRLTKLAQATKNMVTTLAISPASGTYAGAEDGREWSVRLWSPGWTAEAVMVDGREIAACPSTSKNQTGCFDRPTESSVVVRFETKSVTDKQQISVKWRDPALKQASAHFVCSEGREALRAYGVYVIGSHPALGAWDVARAVPLRAAEFSRGVWTNLIDGLPAGVDMEWKCIRKLSGSSTVEWQPGANNRIQTNSGGGYSGIARGGWYFRGSSGTVD